MVAIILVCGLPAAGKSSFVKAIIEKNPTIVCLEYDAIQEKLLCDSPDCVDVAEVEHSLTIQAWRNSRAEALQQLDSLLLQSDSTRGIPAIVLDDNFYLRSMRKQVYQVCQKHKDNLNISFCIIYYNTPLETCLERNQARREQQAKQRPGVPDSVILRMHARMEPPSPTTLTTECWWEQSVLQLDGSADLQENVERFQDYFSTQPLHQVTSPVRTEHDNHLIKNERERTQLACQRDRFLRNCVAVVASIRPSLARGANDIRKYILKEDGEHFDQASLVETFKGKLLQVSYSWSEQERHELESKLLKVTEYSR